MVQIFRYALKALLGTIASYFRNCVTYANSVASIKYEYEDAY